MKNVFIIASLLMLASCISYSPLKVVRAWDYDFVEVDNRENDFSTERVIEDVECYDWYGWIFIVNDLDTIEVRPKEIVNFIGNFDWEKYLFFGMAFISIIYLVISIIIGFRKLNVCDWCGERQSKMNSRFCSVCDAEFKKVVEKNKSAEHPKFSGAKNIETINIDITDEDLKE